MTKRYDVLIIGAGPAGLYTSIILKKGTPMQVPNEPIKVAVAEAKKIGGLTQYSFIQITKKWAFSGRNLIQTLYSEALAANVDFLQNCCVTKISKQEDGFFYIDNNKEPLICKYVIIATGILTYPNIFDVPEKANIGLHTPKEMIKEISDKSHWDKVLVVGNNKDSIQKLASDLWVSKKFKKVDSYIQDKCSSIKDKNFGIDLNLTKKYDGLLFDYNSYKLNNGTTFFLQNLGILQKNGFIKSNAFGETKIPGLFAAGSVTMPISGVPEAIYSAQITGFYVGRLLKKDTIADPSGRFPFFPREANWNYSLQHDIEESRQNQDNVTIK